MKKTIITLTAALLCTVTTIAKDIKTLTLTTTPQMHCEGCENKIKKRAALREGSEEHRHRHTHADRDREL